MDALLLTQVQQHHVIQQPPYSHSCNSEGKGGREGEGGREESYLGITATA